MNGGTSTKIILRKEKENECTWKNCTWRGKEPDEESWHHADLQEEGWKAQLLFPALERGDQKMNLYELTDQFLQLQTMLEDPEVDAQVLADTMEAVEGELEVKADGYGKIIRNFEGNVASIKAELDRLTALKNTYEGSIKRLKENLQASMTATGKKKIETDLFKFSIQKNGGALPVIVDVSTDDLPDECVIIAEKPDLKALAAFLQDPENKEYYSQFAHFGERGESLRIK